MPKENFRRSAEVEILERGSTCSLLSDTIGRRWRARMWLASIRNAIVKIDCPRGRGALRKARWQEIADLHSQRRRQDFLDATLATVKR